MVLLSQRDKRSFDCMAGPRRKGCPMSRRVVGSTISFPSLLVAEELTKVEKETAESFPEC